VVTYIIRRLFGAVLTLLIVSMITFGIFYLIPRWAGGSAESLATRYVGRTASPEQVEAAVKALGLDQPIYVQYWNWLKAIFVGTDFNTGTSVEHCPAPCLGYSFIGRNPVWPDLLDRLPVTASLAFGAAIIWLVSGVRHRGAVRAAPGKLLRPRLDGCGARRRVVADFLDRNHLLGDLQLWARVGRRPAAHIRRSSRTRRCGRTT
jgi:ABC-type dipeptide/oligopeptide/nickel transport system permease component